MMIKRTGVTFCMNNEESIISIALLSLYNSKY